MTSQTAAARAAALLGLGAPPLAAAVLLAAGWLSPGYDAFRFTVSHLGERGAPFALEVNLAFGGLGATYLAMAWALWRPAGPRARAGAMVLGVAGAALIGVALISRSSVHPWPHRAVALVLFLALALAPLAVARGLRAEPRWARHAALSLATFGVSMVLLLIGLAGVLVGGVPAGAWERVFTGLNLTWLTVLAAGLLRAGVAR